MHTLNIANVHEISRWTASHVGGTVGDLAVAEFDAGEGRITLMIFDTQTGFVIPTECYRCPSREIADRKIDNLTDRLTRPQRLGGFTI